MGKAPHNDIIETKFENSKEKIFFKGSNGDNKKFRKQFLKKLDWKLAFHKLLKESAFP